MVSEDDRGHTRVRCNLLGPFELLGDGVPVEFDGPTVPALLVALLLRPEGYGQADQLIIAVWGESKSTTLDNLYHHMSRLRKTLKPLGLGVGRGHYRLLVPPGALDSTEFGRLVAEAAALEDTEPEEALRRLRVALDLWRGPKAFPELQLAGVRSLGHRLDMTRLAAEERLAALEIRYGDPEPLVDRLRTLTRAHPGDATAAAALLRVLRATDRHGEARALYDQLRQRHGVRLPPKVEQAHNDPAYSDLAGGNSRPALPGAGWHPPAELRAKAGYFAGRDDELAQLLSAADPGAARAVAVSAVNGMAGVGKTEVVLQAAHRMVEAGWFPDGSLFVDLRGFSEHDALEPVAALEALLRGLGASGAGVPAETDARAALYRTLVAQRRMLIVLDNARDETQVRPLLPGTASSLVLVTSRRRLAGLDDADQINVDVLPLQEAIRLFRAMVSPHHPGEEATIEEIVRLCGLLPLAIRIAAARLRISRALSPRRLLDSLRDEQGRLRALDDGERSVTAALTVSVRHLPADQQAAFALLGLHPGLEFERYAVAALLDATPGQAQHLLDVLERVNLVDQATPGRYQFHDLVREHAGTMAAVDSRVDSRAALDRLYALYANASSAAMNLIYPYESEQRPAAPPALTTGPDLAGETAAKSWLDAELHNVLAAARHAADHGRVDHTIHQSATLDRHLRTYGKFHQARQLHRRALELAKAAGDNTGMLAAITALGYLNRMFGEYDAAIESQRRAVELARTLGHVSGEINARTELGHVHYVRGEYGAAIDCFERALWLARAAGDMSIAVGALNGLASVHYMQGRTAQSAENYDRARRLAETSQNRQGEFEAALGLAYCVFQQGDLTRAADAFMRALELARRLGSVPGESNSMAGLGQVAFTAAQYGSAARYYTRVLELCTLSGDRSGQLRAHVGLGHVYRLQGDSVRATRSYAEAIELSTESGERAHQLEARLGLGHAYHSGGQPEHAADQHRLALELAQELDQPADVIKALDGLAHACWALPGQRPYARRLWRRALDTLHSLGRSAVDDISAADLEASLNQPD
jgi:tetratricopeptide (TPR) repeat protein/DNA-binding SARP family transcriptional activator